MHVYENAVENNDMIFKLFNLMKNSGCAPVLDCNFSCDWGFLWFPSAPRGKWWENT